MEHESLNQWEFKDSQGAWPNGSHVNMFLDLF